MEIERTENQPESVDIWSQGRKILKKTVVEMANQVEHQEEAHLENFFNKEDNTVDELNKIFENMKHGKTDLTELQRGQKFFRKFTDPFSIHQFLMEFEKSLLAEKIAKNKIHNIHEYTSPVDKRIFLIEHLIMELKGETKENLNEIADDVIWRLRNDEDILGTVTFRIQDPTEKMKILPFYEYKKNRAKIIKSANEGFMKKYKKVIEAGALANGTSVKVSEKYRERVKQKLSQKSLEKQSRMSTPKTPKQFKQKQAKDKDQKLEVITEAIQAENLQETIDEKEQPQGEGNGKFKNAFQCVQFLQAMRKVLKEQKVKAEAELQSRIMDTKALTPANIGTRDVIRNPSMYYEPEDEASKHLQEKIQENLARQGISFENLPTFTEGAETQQNETQQTEPSFPPVITHKVSILPTHSHSHEHQIQTEPAIFTEPILTSEEDDFSREGKVKPFTKVFQTVRTDEATLRGEGSLGALSKSPRMQEPPTVRNIQNSETSPLQPNPEIELNQKQFKIHKQILNKHQQNVEKNIANRQKPFFLNTKGFEQKNPPAIAPHSVKFAMKDHRSGSSAKPSSSSSLFRPETATTNINDDKKRFAYRRLKETGYSFTSLGRQSVFLQTDSSWSKSFMSDKESSHERLNVHITPEVKDRIGNIMNKSLELRGSNIFEEKKIQEELKDQTKHYEMLGDVHQNFRVVSHVDTALVQPFYQYHRGDMIEMKREKEEEIAKYFSVEHQLHPTVVKLKTLSLKFQLKEAINRKRILKFSKTYNQFQLLFYIL